MPTRNFKKLIWSCLSSLWSKQFLIFFFFLTLSAAFWFFEVLNETGEREFEVPVEVRGVPSGVILTDEVPKSVRVVLRDKVAMLLNYRYAQSPGPLVIDFGRVANNSGHVRLMGNDLGKQLAGTLSPGTQIVSIRPDTIDFFYNYGLYKRVPVKLRGAIQTETGYELTGTRLLPDSVTVYASNTMLESITAAYVRPNYLRNITDSTTLELAIEPVKGAKFVPAKVNLRIFVDRMVEKRVKVPIRTVGFPADRELLPIPQEVEVAFYVPMGRYRSIDADDFSVAVHYRDLPTDGSTRCPLRVDRSPEGSSRIRIFPGEVEYVIEEIKH